MGDRMKKYFITGLVILAPLALTLIIILFIFNFLTVPFAGAVAAVFDYYDLFEKGFWFISGKDLQTILAQLLVLLSLFGFTVILGAVARYFFFNSLINFWNYVIHKIPVISSIYKVSQDVINTIFGSKTNSFKQVVMVPFPSKETYSMGLVTREDLTDIVPGGPSVAVFVPTTPNPTSGFLMLYKPEDLIYLDMKVEDAFKYVISCGVILTPFQIVDRKTAHDLEMKRDQAL
jgi:uncharacterized membrane protein